MFIAPGVWLLLSSASYWAFGDCQSQHDCLLSASLPLVLLLGYSTRIYAKGMLLHSLLRALEVFPNPHQILSTGKNWIHSSNHWFLVGAVSEDLKKYQRSKGRGDWGPPRHSMVQEQLVIPSILFLWFEHGHPVRESAIWSVHGWPSVLVQCIVSEYGQWFVMVSDEEWRIQMLSIDLFPVLVQASGGYEDCGLEAGNAAQVTKVVELELTNWGSARVGIPCKWVRFQLDAKGWL
jgi:hypothetical protein